MILPLADALQNCLQDLTSRIAGVDNEQMTGRAMGMGAMLGYGIGTIKEQFKTPENTRTNNNNNSNNGNSQSGFSGFVSRAKAIVMPSTNLSAETDYNENVNPIRTVIPNNSKSNLQVPNYNSTNNQNVNNENKPKTTVIKNVAKTGFNATQAYLNMGAKLTEGDFSKYNNRNINNKKSSFNNTEYINNIPNKQIQKGDGNEYQENNEN